MFTHFKNETTVQRLTSLPKFTQLINGKDESHSVLIVLNSIFYQHLHAA